MKIVNHAAISEASRNFTARNPNATERDRINYMRENHWAAASADFTIFTLEEWQEKLQFHVNSVGMNNAALTTGYSRAPQALTGANELWIGNGTRITLNNGHSLMFDGQQVFMLRGGAGLGLQDRVYGNPDISGIRETAQFANMLRHFANGTLPSGGGAFDNGFAFPNAGRHLDAMGIDTAQNFSVNGVEMRFVNGEIRNVRRN
ncbi:MAG: hypothetical protein LBE35_04770 [Clostridiales bacterium]|jgi:hypothetical protein|nr:hypothetical protein [Clostridiales bacterium]